MLKEGNRHKNRDVIQCHERRILVTSLAFKAVSSLLLGSVRVNKDKFSKMLPKNKEKGRILFSIFYSYEMMIECWKESPESRPSFTQLRDSLEAIMQKDNPYLDLRAVDESRAYYNVPSFHSIGEELSDIKIQVDNKDSCELENDAKTTAKSDVQGNTKSRV